MPVFLLPALGFVKRIPGWVWILLGAIVALWLWGDHREAAGVKKERARWEAVAAKQAAALAVVTAQRDQAVRSADVAGALARQSVEALAARGRDTVKEYYRANPAANVPCVPADRLRAIADADAAAMAAARAAR